MIPTKYQERKARKDVLNGQIIEVFVLKPFIISPLIIYIYALSFKLIGFLFGEDIITSVNFIFPQLKLTTIPFWELGVTLGFVLFIIEKFTFVKSRIQYEEYFEMLCQKAIREEMLK
jgi:hypothetical protein